MSLKTTEMFYVACDGCGKSACEGTEWVAWDVPDAAEEAARDADWLMQDGKHYCHDCYIWDEARDERVPSR